MISCHGGAFSPDFPNIWEAELACRPLASLQAQFEFFWRGSRAEDLEVAFVKFSRRGWFEKQVDPACLREKLFGEV